LLLPTPIIGGSMVCIDSDKLGLGAYYNYNELILNQHIKDPQAFFKRYIPQIWQNGIVPYWQSYG